MMTPLCSARTILARWFSPARWGLWALLAGAAALGAPADPLSRWKSGVAAYEARQYGEAIRLLESAGPSFPKLADYTAFWLASAEYESGNLTAAFEHLAPVWRSAVRSPFSARSALLAARIHLDQQAPSEAIGILKEHWLELPQPEGELLLASGCAAAGDLVAAAVRYQNVFFRYPLSREAADAEAALERLRSSLGETYPPPMPQAVLERIAALSAASDHRRARRELESWIPRLGGLEKEQAEVRLGAADYLAGNAAVAWRYLRNLEVLTPEADAERLYYLVECARRLERNQDISESLERLRQAHPGSPWRLKALVSAGNHYFLDNQAAGYVPLYGACCESFASDPQAAYCHWKVTWQAYLSRSPQASQMLRDHLRQFPGSEKAGAALYFLGRLSEAAPDLSAAAAYFRKLAQRFPGSYYKLLAEQRLAQPACGRSESSSTVSEFLNTLDFPPPSRALDLTPDQPTTLRVERARLLASAGFDNWAEGELRFGARNGGKADLLAMELGNSATRRGAPAQGIRYIKALVGGYLSVPLEPPYTAFWRLAFPLPYRALLERYVKERNLDLYTVAGLIRQESEFDPLAVSRSKAYGLTQVLPSTGLQLSRKIGLRGFRTAMLLRPEINLQLGTYYLRALLDEYGGRWEAALAAYNAGPNRVKAWQEWGSFREPAEFVETIPFTETRNYVQLVLRNAAVYRWLYAQEKPPVQPAPKKKAPARRKSARK
jgi:soluble lytic murein transglycosylase